MARKRERTPVTIMAEKALAAGIHPPVVAHFSGPFPSQVCHLIWAARSDAYPTNSVPILDTWSLAEACDLLRSCAGIGGRAVANLMELLAGDVRWWSVDLRHRGLDVKAHDRRRMFRIRVPYEGILDVPRQDCPDQAARRDVVHCHLRRDSPAMACSGTPEETRKTVNLLRVAANHCLPAIGSGVAPPLILRDADLEKLLLWDYYDYPHLVAAVIKTLRKAGDRRDAWIIAVLDNRPELEDLWTEVQRELDDYDSLDG